MRLPDTGLTGIFDAAFACPPSRPCGFCALPARGDGGGAEPLTCRGALESVCLISSRLCCTENHLSCIIKRGCMGKLCLLYPKGDAARSDKTDKRGNTNMNRDFADDLVRGTLEKKCPAWARALLVLAAAV